MVDHDDEALARLQASDPATGSHPDLHSLRGRIAQKAPASLGSERATALSDDTLQGPRVRAPWVAAAAIAAFAVGGGGYAVGAATAPGDGGVVAGQGSATDEASSTGGPVGDSTGGVVTGEAERLGDPSSTEAMGGDAGSGAAYDPGPVRLVAGEGLPTERGTGEVRVVVSDADPEEFLDAWADRLGLEGTPLTPDDEAGWFGQNGLVDAESGRMVSVSADGSGPLTFSYEDMYGSPYCGDMYAEMSGQDLALAKEEWSRGVGADIPFPDSERCRDLEGARPADEQALASATDFLTTTGLDLDSYALSVAEWDDPAGSIVTVVGTLTGTGALTGEQLNVQVGPEGVFSAWGSTGELTSLGDYPVISAAEAVERYGQREFTNDYGVMIAEDTTVGGDATSLPAPEFTFPDPVPLEPGSPIPLLLMDKVVTGAELVRGMLWSPTGGQLEVPVWKLMTPDGMHYTVLAVAEEGIAWQGWE
ncbi:hypothetical protein [Ornithinimicrobium sp. LYQ103]|uniref:hypothetical protein n=1 Tax=Ornithinimicrobium sp. LYQ103 TaxID=3378796 RepID=UPI0038528D82